MAAAVGSADASAQQAPSPSPPPAASDKSAADDPNRVICHKEQVTGSRFYKRICLTKAEWDQQTAAAAEMQRINSQRAGMGQAMAGGGMGGNGH